MTIREVEMSTSNIQNEIINEKKFEASIHNREINFPGVSESLSSKEFSDNEKAAIEKDRDNFFNKGK
jgi:hypothetical protein